MTTSTTYTHHGADTARERVNFEAPFYLPVDQPNVLAILIHSVRLISETYQPRRRVGYVWHTTLRGESSLVSEGACTKRSQVRFLSSAHARHCFRHELPCLFSESTLTCSTIRCTTVIYHGSCSACCHHHEDIMDPVQSQRKCVTATTSERVPELAFSVTVDGCARRAFSSAS